MELFQVVLFSFTGEDGFERRSNALQIPFLVKEYLYNYHVAFYELNFDVETFNFLARGHTDEWTDSHNECLVKIFNHFHDLMSKFATKCFMFRSLSDNDRELLLTSNSGMFTMYIIARYFTADSGIGQLSTISGPISPIIGKLALRPWNLKTSQS